MKRVINVKVEYDLDYEDFKNSKLTQTKIVRDIVENELSELFSEDEGYISTNVIVTDTKESDKLFTSQDELINDIILLLQNHENDGAYDFAINNHINTFKENKVNINYDVIMEEDGFSYPVHKCHLKSFIHKYYDSVINSVCDVLKSYQVNKTNLNYDTFKNEKLNKIKERFKG